MIGRKKIRRSVIKGTACICFAIAAFALVLQGARAQPPYSITVTTDRNSYSRGDLVTITGTITPPDQGVDVGVEVRGPGGGTIWIDTVATDFSGSYFSQFRLDPSAPYGVYTVWASPTGSNTNSWCEFTIPQAAETTTTVTISGRTYTIVRVVTTAVPQTTVTEFAGTVTVGTTVRVVTGTTETKLTKETTSVTLTQTQTTLSKETTSLTLTETETTTVQIFDPVRLVKWWASEPAVQVGVPIFLVGVAPAVLIFAIIRRRRKQEKRRMEELDRLEGKSQAEE